jgi:3-oxoacyl-[acyl-carrier protein] reductase
MGRHVLVTGGSRGIGRAIVRQLAERGVDVTFTYRSSAEAARELTALCAEAAGEVRALRYDLDAGDPDQLLGECLNGPGRLDGLILNAATWAGGTLQNLDDEAWWGVVETNLRGTVRIARAALKPLTTSTSGSVTLIASTVGLIGFPGDTAYASSKSALTGFARSLAKELGQHGTRVNVLAPGFVDTDMTARVPPTARDRILARTVLGRFATCEEIAAAAVFLSEDAGYATGVVLPLDGGWTL